MLAWGVRVWFNDARMREGKPGFEDPFRPPDIPTEVCCMHCGEEYESYLIHWEARDGAEGLDGFWCCGTPGCDGKGFCFDIWPTDPEWRDEDGEKVMFFDDDDDDEEGEDVEDLESEFPDDTDPAPNAEGERNGNDPPDTLTDEDIPW